MEVYKTLRIQNFKSIVDCTLELGRVNVFIGENGCGKSNILEAVGLASTALLNPYGMDNNVLASKGVRLARPSMMVNAFRDSSQSSDIKISVGEVEVLLVREGEDSYKSPKISTATLQESHPLSTKDGTDLDNMVNDFALDKSYAAIVYQHLPKMGKYAIYTLNTPALRGFTHESKTDPVGINGEKLDILIANLDEEERKGLKEYSYITSWLEDFLLDTQDILKLKGFKQNLSQSRLYFSDKFMSDDNNIFSSENANEGILHVLFYLSLLISKKSPDFFAIDNIESSLNPALCRLLGKEVCNLAKSKKKQLLITTHNPAFLDGLNLNDPEVRLFEVYRNDNGHTNARRITFKPEVMNDFGEKYKLSELWTRGFLGAKPKNF